MRITGSWRGKFWLIEWVVRVCEICDKMAGERVGRRGGGGGWVCWVGCVLSEYEEIHETLKTIERFDHRIVIQTLRVRVEPAGSAWQTISPMLPGTAAATLSNVMPLLRAYNTYCASSKS